jgi:predicted MFS family arabinose efflux permease
MTAVAADPSPLRLAFAGIGAVGTSFGMARYGYGLLLPDIQRSYRIDAATLGAIGAGSYAAYLLAATVAGARAQELGTRTMVVLGGLLATVGMVIAGLTHGPLGLAVGVLVGGASSGIVYPPFSDAVAQLPPSLRGRTLSAINCGTGYGVAIAAPIAILAGSAWREAWLGFAACALLTTLYAARVLPGRAVRRSAPAHPASAATPGGRGRRLIAPGAIPLLLGGLVIGLASAAYWTFAVDHLQRDGGLSIADSRWFLGVVGVASLLSTFTGDLVRRLSGRVVFTGAALLEASSLALLAIAPSSLVAVMVSAMLFGAAYNSVVAVEALWSARRYPERPSLGLAAAMAANAAGLLCGPLASGALADAVGLTDVLLGGAAIAVAAAALAPRIAIVAGERRTVAEPSAPCA